MRSAIAKEHMKRRSAVVEPVFAVLKEHLGLRRFLRIGLENASAEWHLSCAAHNLRKMWRYRLVWSAQCAG
jgi:transposase